jgi:hypothetical protein
MCRCVSFVDKYQRLEREREKTVVSLFRGKETSIYGRLPRRYITEDRNLKIQVLGQHYNSCFGT